MGLLLFKSFPWQYFILLLWIVKLSNQSTTNCNGDTLEEMKNLILGRLNDIEYKLAKVSEMENKLSNMEAKLNQMDNQIDKTLITFNPVETMLIIGQEAQLDCGVIGVYSSCLWEHKGSIYQLADIINGSHSDMKATANDINNQCGIIIRSVNRSHEGDWTCKVFTSGPHLTASKMVTVAECEPPCNNGGTCLAPQLACTCTEYWTGPTCEIPICDPACNNGGKCSAPNSCSCTVNWSGSTCKIPVCDPPCNNGGTCSAPNSCICASKWTGVTCETLVCPEGFLKSNGSEQCFKIFKGENRKWDQAKTKCELEGLQLAEMTDDVAVTLRKDLLDKYGDGTVWVAARGEISDFIWQYSRRKLDRRSPLWEPGEPDNGYGIDRCVHLEVLRRDWNMHPGRPYATNGCGSGFGFVCEVIVE